MANTKFGTKGGVTEKRGGRGRGLAKVKDGAWVKELCLTKPISIKGL